MAEPDRSKITADWASRGFSCDLWTDPPGQRWEDFRGATDELIMVLEGKVEFEIAGKVHLPKVGEELLIPAGAIHSAGNIGKITARWLYGYRECQQVLRETAQRFRGFLSRLDSRCQRRDYCRYAYPLDWHLKETTLACIRSRAEADMRAVMSRPRRWLDLAAQVEWQDDG